MADTRTQRNGPRTRTFTGCRTCRDRHLKCDEAKPTCSSCWRLNTPCEGYAPRLLWMSQRASSKPDADHRAKGSSYRFLLFADHVRESLSEQLTQSLGGQSADRVVTHLGGMAVPDQDADYHAVGPFGVFRAFGDPSGLAKQGEDTSETEESAHSAADSGVQDMTSTSIDEFLCSGDDLTRELLESWQENIDGLHTETISSQNQPQQHEHGNICVQRSPGPAHNNAGMAAMLISQPGSPFPPFSFNLPDANSVVSSSPKQTAQRCTNHPRPGGDRDEEMDEVEAEIVPRLDAIPPRMPTPTDPGGTSVLPAYADQLLRYLKIEVLGRATALYPSRISPWKELLLPCALETYAELSLWNHASHTRLSILCTLLAKSAHHLHVTSRDNPDLASHWYGVAVKHQHRGQEHLKQALTTELDGTSRAKYAETLMAILGVGFVLVSQRVSAIRYTPFMEDTDTALNRCTLTARGGSRS